MIEQLLGMMTSATFLREYFLKLPFALPEAARDFIPLGSWGMVEAIASQPEVDLLIVRQGQRWEGPSRPSYPQIRELHASGYTVLIRHAEKHDPRLAQLASGFRDDFRSPVDIHIYCTPAGQRGFGWHYDAEDVFILQTEGGKEYLLRKNTVNPWPTIETLPQDMAYEREIMPLMKCSLLAGDWLYIPAGYWHCAQADEAAISLAIGVLSPTAIDFIDYLRPQLLSSLLWRQRLPVIGNASPLTDQELVEQYNTLIEELSNDVVSQIRSEEFVRGYLESRRGRQETRDV